MFLITTKLLITQSGIGGVDNECGSKFLGVILSYIPCTEHFELAHADHLHMHGVTMLLSTDLVCYYSTSWHT